jgi:hypothetical protein
MPDRVHSPAHSRVTLTERDGATRLVHEGELGIDLWRAGAWWGKKVADCWERAVAGSLAWVKEEAERRARR